MIYPEGVELKSRNTFNAPTSMRNVDAECMPYIFSNLDDESEAV